MHTPRTHWQLVPGVFASGGGHARRQQRHQDRQQLDVLDAAHFERRVASAQKRAKLVEARRDIQENEQSGERSGMKNERDEHAHSKKEKEKK